MLNIFSKYNVQTAVISIGVVLLFVACMSTGLTASAQVRESGTVIVDNADVRVTAKKMPAIFNKENNLSIAHQIELTWTLKNSQIESIQSINDYDLGSAFATDGITYSLTKAAPVRDVRLFETLNIGSFRTTQKVVFTIHQEPYISGDYGVILKELKYIKTLSGEESEVTVPVEFSSSLTKFVATDTTAAPIFHSVTVSYPKSTDPVIKVEASFTLKKDKVTDSCERIVIGTVEWSTNGNEKTEEIYGSSCVVGPQRKELTYKIKDRINDNNAINYTIEIFDTKGTRRYRDVGVSPNTDSYSASDIQSIEFNKTTYQINPFEENVLVNVFGRNGFSHEYTILGKGGNKFFVRYFEVVNGHQSADSRFIGEQNVLIQKLKEAKRQPSFSKASIRSVTQTNRYSRTVAKDLAQTFEIELVNGRKYKIDTSLNDLQRFKNVLNTIGFVGTVNDIIDFDLTNVGETSDTQDLVKELRDQLSELNSQASSSVALKIGSAVTVTDNLRVRKLPGTTSAYIGTQSTGARGTVIEGPVRADGHTWFKVDYVAGVDGWNAAGWLKKMTDYEGEQEALTKCRYNKKNYIEGYILRMPLLSTDLNSDYPELKEAEYKCRGGIWTLQDNSGAVYLFTDTESITKQDVDPNKSKSGDEYTLYKIILKDNVAKHEVKIFKKMSKSVRDAEFRKTGYIGSVNNLIASARLVKDSNQINQVQNLEKTPSSEVIPTDVVTADEQVKKGATTTTPAPRFNTITNLTGIGETKVSAVFATTRSLKTGPIVFGTINWGDGTVTEPVSALVLGTETTVNLTHVYKRNGTYTITLTALDDKSATQKVIISKPTPSPTPKPLPVIPQPTPTPKPPVVTPTPKPTPIPPVAAITYTLTDISVVTKKLIDPNKAAIDDEYTLYTITLKNKKTYSVKVFGNQQPSLRDANFKKTGYTGDVVKLLSMAKVVSTTPAPIPVVKGATTDVYTEIANTLRTISVLLEEVR